ncbi:MULTISPECIES: hypothetical protein [Halorubrum]|uniref:hypothetical protein n=1 Tax=Halorubrum TaxID=56688 RepID=UPI000F85761F|nr:MULTISPECIES: hypothetical protein [Halorubrum]AZQ14504.1 hypothetical protein DOS48_06475 [Halorubrum sp. PV6]
MSTHPESVSGTSDPGADAEGRRFDGPWLRFLAVAAVGWTVLYAVDWALLTAGTPVGAAVAFAHGYLLAPLATAAVLLDALSLAERGVAEFGLFKWLYALVALYAPPVAVVYYAHREWLKPGEPDLLGGPP